MHTVKKPKKDWKYSDYKNAGICPCCKSKTPSHGMALCEPCRQRRLLPHNRAKQTEMVRNYVNKNREQGFCDRCKNLTMPGTKVCSTCADKAKLKRDIIRNTILEHYGNRCACCGETEQQFLTIDHINNDGHIERKLLGGYSGGFYSSIIKRGFPDTYQILCWNCNCAKGRYGRCPHELNKDQKNEDTK